MDFDLDIPPPSQDEIDEERARLTRNINHLNRMSLHLLKTQRDLDWSAVPPKPFHTFKILSFFAVTLVLLSFSVTIAFFFIFACLTFLIQIRNALTCQENVHASLAIINEDEASLLIDYCTRFPKIDAYRLKVATMGRPLVKAEFEMIKKCNTEINSY